MTSAYIKDTYAVTGCRSNAIKWKKLLGNDYILMENDQDNPSFNTYEFVSTLQGAIHITNTSIYCRMESFGSAFDSYNDVIMDWKHVGPMLIVWVMDPRHNQTQDEIDYYNELLSRLDIPGLLVTHGQSDACNLIKQRMKELTYTPTRKRMGGS